MCDKLSGMATGYLAHNVKDDRLTAARLGATNQRGEHGTILVNTFFDELTAVVGR